MVKRFSLFPLLFALVFHPSIPLFYKLSGVDEAAVFNSSAGNWMHALLQCMHRMCRAAGYCDICVNKASQLNTHVNDFVCCMWHNYELTQVAIAPLWPRSFAPGKYTSRVPSTTQLSTLYILRERKCKSKQCVSKTNYNTAISCSFYYANVLFNGCQLVQLIWWNYFAAATSCKSPRCSNYAQKVERSIRCLPSGYWHPSEWSEKNQEQLLVVVSTIGRSQKMIYWKVIQTWL